MITKDIFLGFILWLAYFTPNSLQKPQVEYGGRSRLQGIIYGDQNPGSYDVNKVHKDGYDNTNKANTVSLGKYNTYDYGGLTNKLKLDSIEKNSGYHSLLGKTNKLNYGSYGGDGVIGLGGGKLGGIGSTIQTDRGVGGALPGGGSYNWGTNQNLEDSSVPSYSPTSKANQPAWLSSKWQTKQFQGVPGVPQYTQPNSGGQSFIVTSGGPSSAQVSTSYILKPETLSSLISAGLLPKGKLADKLGQYVNAGKPIPTELFEELKRFLPPNMFQTAAGGFNVQTSQFVYLSREQLNLLISSGALPNGILADKLKDYVFSGRPVPNDLYQQLVSSLPPGMIDSSNGNNINVPVFIFPPEYLEALVSNNLLSEGPILEKLRKIVNVGQPVPLELLKELQSVLPPGTLTFDKGSVKIKIIVKQYLLSRQMLDLLMNNVLLPKGPLADKIIYYVNSGKPIPYDLFQELLSTVPTGVIQVTNGGVSVQVPKPSFTLSPETLQFFISRGMLPKDLIDKLTIYVQTGKPIPNELVQELEMIVPPNTISTDNGVITLKPSESTYILLPDVLQLLMLNNKLPRGPLADKLTQYVTAGKPLPNEIYQELIATLPPGTIAPNDGSNTIQITGPSYIVPNDVLQLLLANKLIPNGPLFDKVVQYINSGQPIPYEVFSELKSIVPPGTLSTNPNSNVLDFKGPSYIISPEILQLLISRGSLPGQLTDKLIPYVNLGKPIPYDIYQELLSTAPSGTLVPQPNNRDIVYKGPSYNLPQDILQLLISNGALPQGPLVDNLTSYVNSREPLPYDIYKDIQKHLPPGTLLPESGSPNIQFSGPSYILTPDVLQILLANKLIPEGQLAATLTDCVNSGDPLPFTVYKELERILPSGTIFTKPGTPIIQYSGPSYTISPDVLQRLESNERLTKGPVLDKIRPYVTAGQPIPNDIYKELESQICSGTLLSKPGSNSVEYTGPSYTLSPEILQILISSGNLQDNLLVEKLTTYVNSGKPLPYELYKLLVSTLPVGTFSIVPGSNNIQFNGPSYTLSPELLQVLRTNGAIPEGPLYDQIGKYVSLGNPLPFELYKQIVSLLPVGTLVKRPGTNEVEFNGPSLIVTPEIFQLLISSGLLNNETLAKELSPYVNFGKPIPYMFYKDLETSLPKGTLFLEPDNKYAQYAGPSYSLPDEVLQLLAANVLLPQSPIIEKLRQYVNHGKLPYQLYKELVSRVGPGVLVPAPDNNDIQYTGPSYTISPETMQLLIANALLPQGPLIERLSPYINYEKPLPYDLYKEVESILPPFTFIREPGTKTLHYKGPSYILSPDILQLLVSNRALPTGPLVNKVKQYVEGRLPLPYEIYKELESAVMPGHFVPKPNSNIVQYKGPSYTLTPEVLQLLVMNGQVPTGPLAEEILQHVKAGNPIPYDIYQQLVSNLPPGTLIPEAQSHNVKYTGSSYVLPPDIFQLLILNGLLARGPLTDKIDQFVNSEQPIPYDIYKDLESALPSGTLLPEFGTRNVNFTGPSYILSPEIFNMLITNFELPKGPLTDYLSQYVNPERPIPYDLYKMLQEALPPNTLNNTPDSNVIQYRGPAYTITPEILQALLANGALPSPYLVNNLSQYVSSGQPLPYELYKQIEPFVCFGTMSPKPGSNTVHFVGPSYVLPIDILNLLTSKEELQNRDLIKQINPYVTFGKPLPHDLYLQLLANVPSNTLYTKPDTNVIQYSRPSYKLPSETLQLLTMNGLLPKPLGDEISQYVNSNQPIPHDLFNKVVSSLPHGILSHKPSNNVIQYKGPSYIMPPEVLQLLKVNKLLPDGPLLDKLIPFVNSGNPLPYERYVNLLSNVPSGILVPRPGSNIIEYHGPSYVLSPEIVQLLTLQNVLPKGPLTDTITRHVNSGQPLPYDIFQQLESIVPAGTFLWKPGSVTMDVTEESHILRPEILQKFKLPEGPLADKIKPYIITGKPLPFDMIKELYDIASLQVAPAYPAPSPSRPETSTYPPVLPTQPPVSSNVPISSLIDQLNVLVHQGNGIPVDTSQQIYNIILKEINNAGALSPQLQKLLTIFISSGSFPDSALGSQLIRFITSGQNIPSYLLQQLQSIFSQLYQPNAVGGLTGQGTKYFLSQENLNAIIYNGWLKPGMLLNGLRQLVNSNQPLSLELIEQLEAAIGRGKGYLIPFLTKYQVQVVQGGSGYQRLPAGSFQIGGSQGGWKQIVGNPSAVDLSSGQSGYQVSNVPFISQGGQGHPFIVQQKPAGTSIIRQG